MSQYARYGIAFCAVAIGASFAYSLFSLVLMAQRRALESFDLLPPEIRERFNNDPRKFFEFLLVSY